MSWWLATSGGGLPNGPAASTRSAGWWLRLAAAQALGFTAMEAIERMGSGLPVAGMFAHHLYLLGLAVQFLAACTGGLILLALSRAALRLARAVSGLPHSASSWPWTTSRSIPGWWPPSRSG